MPKETINNLYGDWSIKVGWSKDTGWVQVATVAPDMPLVTDETLEESNGWWVDLDYDTLSELIKVLNRVKRQIGHVPIPSDN